MKQFGYGPYGEVVAGEVTETPFLFNGQFGVMSDGNGLYYMRARYYSPEIKRFVNRDVLLGSVGEGQSLNRFAFVSGRPVSLVDPFGLQGIPIGEYYGNPLDRITEEDLTAMIADYKASLPNQFTFLLNEETMSKLTEINSGEWWNAFSGYGEHQNDPESVKIVGYGPLPQGTYYIVDRPSGMFSGLIEWWQNSSKRKWFALYRDDEMIDDETLINGVLRKSFRLHPGQVSLGCITLPMKMISDCCGKNFLVQNRLLFQVQQFVIMGLS